MNKSMYASSLLWGAVSTAALLVIFLLVATAISGKAYAQDQLEQFWPYLISLAVGFGIQVAMYAFLRQATRVQAGRTVTVTGATSTLSMLSCCAHYLVNILPVIGITGVISFISQYQIQFFWVGLLANAIGILFVSRKVLAYTKEAL